MATEFVEKDCTFEHQGRKFTAGGAWLQDCGDGYMRGVVYAKPDTHNAGIVTDWHGNQLARAAFGPVYRGGFCKMRSVSFTIDGVNYAGRYCPDNSQAVRVKSTKRVN